MASIMEKDVLLEMVATAIAFIDTRTDAMHPKRKEMIELRNYFYRTDHEDIDMLENVAKIKPIIDELDKMPDILGE